jgi:hypothetical protein
VQARAMADPHRRAHGAGIRLLTSAPLQDISDILTELNSTLESLAPTFSPFGKGQIQPGSLRMNGSTQENHVAVISLAPTRRELLSTTTAAAAIRSSLGALRAVAADASIRPLSVNFPQEQLDDLRRRVGRTMRPSQTTRRARSSPWLQAIISAPPPRCLTDRRQPAVDGYPAARGRRLACPTRS